MASISSAVSAMLPALSAATTEFWWAIWLPVVVGVFQWVSAETISVDGWLPTTSELAAALVDSSTIPPFHRKIQLLVG